MIMICNVLKNYFDLECREKKSFDSECAQNYYVENKQTCL